jgi:hypothetical protein
LNEAGFAASFVERESEAKKGQKLLKKFCGEGKVFRLFGSFSAIEARK